MPGQALYAFFVVFSGITMTWAHNTALLLPCVVSILRASFCGSNGNRRLALWSFGSPVFHKIKAEDHVMLVMLSSDLNRGSLKTNVRLRMALHLWCYAHSSLCGYRIMNQNFTLFN
ncbi:hypothetical protein BKA60DRAFT_187966 [Fusarium oxysporum]|nr:hypothetical protein BKA60DRAFT_187966 [Fusarium oxysporum]